jgi:4'-phosphopantetheinyl transferase
MLYFVTPLFRKNAEKKGIVTYFRKKDSHMTKRSDTAYVYYSLIGEWLTSSTYLERLSTLPKHIASRILEYENPEDQQLRLCGKTLLIALLQDLLPDRTENLNNLIYSSTNRPLIPGGIDFNTSHSGHIAACGATLEGCIGLDVEMIRPLQLIEYKAYFSGKEWKAIEESPAPLSAFYYFWTRKEALLKAIGCGMVENLSSFDTCSDLLARNGSRYYFHTLPLHPSYMAHAVTNVSQKISLQQKSF